MEAKVYGTDLNKDEAELIFIRFIKESQVNNNYIYREQLSKNAKKR